jgi:hypothetical protein
VNDYLLILCDRCGTPLELPAGQLEALARYEEYLGERVVVHCSPCFAEVTSRETRARR